jgi:hypothetical protein
MRGGVDAWEGRGRFGVVSSGLRLAAGRDRLAAGVDGSSWFGQDRFGSVALSVRFRSGDGRQRREFIVRGGGAATTAATPPDLWFAGDTGTARPVLLRAHPVVDEGELQSQQLGRRVAYLSNEARQWWSVKSAVRFGVAVFADAAHVGRRATAAGRGDVDVGGGLRVGFPGLDGVFRVDIGKGLRDGSTAFSFVYEP